MPTAIEEVKEDVRKLFDRTLPQWVLRGLVAAVVCSFLAISGNYLYATSTYARKDDVKELKRDINKSIDGLRTEQKASTKDILDAIKDKQ